MTEKAPTQVIDTEIPEKLINTYRDVGRVIANLEDYPGADHTQLAIEMSAIEGGVCTTDVLGNVDKFTGLDRAEYAKWLAENSLSKYVFRNQQLFEGVDLNEVAVIAARDGGARDEDILAFMYDPQVDIVPDIPRIEAALKEGEDKRHTEYLSAISKGSGNYKARVELALESKEQLEARLSELSGQRGELNIILRPLQDKIEEAKSRGDDVAVKILSEAYEPYETEFARLEAEISDTEVLIQGADTNRKAGLFDAREHYDQFKDEYQENAVNDARANGVEVTFGREK
jgi:hypothetical protein